MKRDVTNRDTMRELQGDLVLVDSEMVLTIVRVIDTDRQYLLLANRQTKAREEWLFDQGLLDRLVPIKDLRAKWALNLDS